LVTTSRGGIKEIVSFRDASLFGAFELPAEAS
jgi:hypothetical protein